VGVPDVVFGAVVLDQPSGHCLVGDGDQLAVTGLSNLTKSP
jgi:hypothetical protein